MFTRLATTTLVIVALLGAIVPAARGADPDKSASISGTITDAGTGDGVGEICADALTLDGTLAGRGLSDTTGRYTIPRLYPDVYVVRVNDCPGGRNQDYPLEFWDGQKTLVSAQPITVVVDEHRTGIDTDLVPGSTDGVYYVAPDGLDTRRPACPGGTKTHPWRTIEHGMRCLHPGDTLLVRGGTYTQRVLPVVRPGTRTAPIRVSAHPGERVVVRGLIRLAGADYWSLEGLEITNDGQPYDGGEYLLKMRDGVGWDVLNMRVTNAHSYGALRVETSDDSSNGPADWRVADSCIAHTHPTHAPYRDHNLYIATGLHAGRGLIERNLVFGATNGQNIKLGAGNGPAGGTANVVVRYNTLWRGVQNVLASGPSRNNVLERNLLGGVILPADKAWYPNVRGFDLDGSGNVARDNLATTSGARQTFLFNDDNSTAGWQTGGGNRFPASPRLANPDRCDGFQVTNPDARAYGHLARTPHDDLPAACPPDRYPRNLFTDDDYSVHEVAIDCVAWDEHGIARGLNAGQFGPSRIVRRDQMASFVARLLAALDVTLPAGAPDAFSDDGDSTHEDAINQLAVLGVVGGVGDARYAPDAAVSREQMATFLVRAAELAAGAALVQGKDHFRDDETSVHEPNINAAANAGIAAGVGDGRYAPRAAVRREQMATFLARTLETLGGS